VELTVFVVDDDEAARDSLTFLMRANGFTCRAYASASAFLSQLSPEHRGCMITDVRMPEMDGIALVSRLKDIGSQIPVIVMTGHADVPLAVKALKAGVADFIEKPFESDAIISAVRHCLELTRVSHAKESQKILVDRRMATLTEREKQVFVALHEGQSNKEIAVSLDISPRTVEIYRANVMSKMQAGSLSDLVKMMIISQAAPSVH
jgi:two-component system response regulator FixJ